MSKLKKYQILDASEELRFHLHADIVGECFGVPISKQHREGTWSNSNKWMACFPKFLKDIQGNPKETDGGWVNDSRDDWNVLYEFTENQSIASKYIDSLEEDYYRLVFCYDPKEKDYFFRGVYVCSKSETSAAFHVFRRISKKVELIGEPVSSISVIDPVKPIELARQELLADEDEINTDVELLELTGETRDVVVKARINQGEFRKQLIGKHGQCCLCKVKNKDILLASHIKPWCKSDRNERVDVYNGLLLCPNHDKLFDKGYISFDDSGAIMISSELSDIDRIYMNVNEELKINLADESKAYMAYHRENIFRK